jgi:hypothetical protein
MDKDELRLRLGCEVGRWSAKSYDALKTELRDVVAYSLGEGLEFYQVEVQLLESEPEYVHVGVAVDDGGWRAYMPRSTSFLVYRDGRVGK